MEYKSIDEFYKACGDSIRAKKNTTAPVPKKEIPNEILSIPTNEALKIDSLDESLLTEENVGKLYECGGKLYRIVGKGITTLQGATIEFNEELPIPNKDTFSYTFNGSCYIDNKFQDIFEISYANDIELGIGYTIYFYKEGGEGSYVYAYYSKPELTDISGWNYDNGYGEYIKMSTLIVNNFDFPDLNEHKIFVEWVLANAKVSNVNYGSYVFEELSSVTTKPLWDGNDLKGTTWLFNKQMTSELLPSTLNIIGIANDGVRYTAGNYIYSTMDTYNNVYIFGDKEHNTFPSFMYSIGNSSMVYQYQEYVYDEFQEEDIAVNKFIETNNVSVTIYDGADTTLPFLINWFKENAELVSHIMIDE